MKLPCWSVLALVIMPALAAAQESAPDSGDANAEQELIQLEKDWGRALRTRDVDTLKRILADDLVYTSPDGERRSKAQELETISSGRYVISEISDEPNQVKVFGDVAVVIGGHTEKSTYDGQDTSGRYRWTETFVKRDGRWQVVAGQINRVSPAP